MSRCKELVLLTAFLAFAVLFSGCITQGINLGNVTAEGNCASGTITFCRNDSSACNCSGTWEPVCGADGRTYPNRCAAQCANVQFTQGECGLSCAQFGEQCGVIATTGAAVIKMDCCDGACMDGMCQKPDQVVCEDGTVVASADQCPSLGLQGPDEPCLCMANWDPVCGINGVTYENKCVAMCKQVEVAYSGPCENMCVQEGLPCGVVAGVAANYASDQTCCEGVMCIQGICQKPHGYTCADGTIVESPNECPATDCGCPTDWDPVCLTSEGKTYPNKCIARCGGIDPEKLTPGECNPRDACGTEGYECYQSTSECKIDNMTGEKYCENVTWSTCCEGFACSEGMCKPEIPACAMRGETCDQKQCCDGYDCTYSYAGYLASTNVPQKICTKPECRKDADRCVEGGECCSGSCVDNHCGSSNGCRPEGKTCEKNGQCCSEFCKDGVCAKRENNCLPSGDSCKENWMCCSGICNPDTYTCIDLCVNAGEQCSDTKPCCPNSGAYCSDNGICTKPSEACNSEGSRCGSPSNTLAAFVPSYGACCEGMECINYHCGQPQACDCPDVYEPICGADGKTYGNTCRARCAGTYGTYNGPCRNETICRQAFERCGRVYDQTTNVVRYYGDCCDTYRCTNNVCVPPQQECPNLCRQRGDGCGTPRLFTALHASLGECCDGMSCVDNRCSGTNECVPVGEQCYVPPQTLTHMVPTNFQSNCCEGARCMNGSCREIPPGCNQTGQRCINDNNCCQGRCENNTCNPGQPPCRKTGETCSPGQQNCCETTDACVQNPNIATHASYICTPTASPTPTPTPQCRQKHASCSPNIDTCCEATDACVQNPNIFTHVAYWCEVPAVTPTPAPTPQCQYEYCVDGVFVTGCSYNPQTNNCQCTTRVPCASQVCDPTGKYCGAAPTPSPTPVCVSRTGTCVPGVDTCCSGLSCVQNPNVMTHVAYWCYAPATPTPTPVQMCSDTDDDTARNPNIYLKGTATGTLPTGGSGTFTDYCLDSSRLYEYDCKLAGQDPEVVPTIVTCPRGTSCVNGACTQGAA